MYTKKSISYKLSDLTWVFCLLRCRECLPEQWFCGACDMHNHSKRPLHNRDSVVDGFFKAIPPSTCISRGETGIYATHEQGKVWQIYLSRLPDPYLVYSVCCHIQNVHFSFRQIAFYPQCQHSTAPARSLASQWKLGNQSSWLPSMVETSSLFRLLLV